MDTCQGRGQRLSYQKLRKDIKVEKYPDRKTINLPNIIFTPARVGWGGSSFEFKDQFKLSQSTSLVTVISAVSV